MTLKEHALVQNGERLALAAQLLAQVQLAREPTQLMSLEALVAEVGAWVEWVNEEIEEKLDDTDDGED